MKTLLNFLLFILTIPIFILFGLILGTMYVIYKIDQLPIITVKVRI